MKYTLSRILCTALCCAPLVVSAQTSEKETSPRQLFQEGQSLFRQRAYAASILPLQHYVQLTEQGHQPMPDTDEREEAGYMLACAAYETQDARRIELLRNYLEEYPDTPHANRGAY